MFYFNTSCTLRICTLDYLKLFVKEFFFSNEFFFIFRVLLLKKKSLLRTMGLLSTHCWGFFFSFGPVFSSSLTMNSISFLGPFRLGASCVLLIILCNRVLIKMCKKWFHCIITQYYKPETDLPFFRI